MSSCPYNHVIMGEDIVWCLLGHDLFFKQSQAKIKDSTLLPPFLLQCKTRLVKLKGVSHAFI